MIGNERVVALIPARGGSKGVRLKNLHPLGGRPLLSWPIEVARATPEIDRIIVSTDHQQIADTGREYGAEVQIRPAELASDTATAISVVRYHIKKLREEGETAKYMLLLEPTAPFRLPKDIRACLEMMEGRGLDSVATFGEAHLNPHRAWKIVDGEPQVFIEGAVPWLRRQEQPEAYMLNGLVYGFVMDKLPEDSLSILFGRMGAVQIERIRSFDIDDITDFMVANALLEQNLIPLT